MSEVLLSPKGEVSTNKQGLREVSISVDVVRSGDSPKKRRGVTVTTSYHTYTEGEKRAFCVRINQLLRQDVDLQGQLPMNPESKQLFDVASKGVLLCKLIERIAPGSMKKYKVNNKPKDIFNVIINHNASIDAARELGCSIINIGPQDFIDKQEHLILAFIWQLLKVELLRGVESIEMENYFVPSELVKADTVIVEKMKAEAAPSKRSPEIALLRWFNGMLSRSSQPNRQVRNFSEDIQDSEAYILLMNQICPELCTLDPLQIGDRTERAGIVVANAEKMGCMRFVAPDDIVQGARKLNLAFTATLFHKYAELGDQRKIIWQQEEEMRKKKEALEAAIRAEEEARKQGEESKRKAEDEAKLKLNEERKRQEKQRLENIADEERERFRRLRFEEEKERQKKIESAIQAETQEAQLRESKQRTQKENEERKRLERDRLNAERSEYPTVILVSDEPEKFLEIEEHLLREGRNAIFCEMENAISKMEETKSDYIVLTGLFDDDGEEHDAQLDLASSIVEKYGEKKKVICYNSIIKQKPLIQKRCEAFGLIPVKRGQSLWKLLGVKDAPLKQGLVAKPKPTAPKKK